MGTLFILLLTSACFTDFQRVKDKNGLGRDDLQYGGTNDSGGVLNSSQARFDMQHLELELKILPASKSIEGSALLDVLVVEPLEEILLDLDSLLVVSEVQLSVKGTGSIPSRFLHVDGKLHVYPSLLLPSQSLVSVNVVYSGQPLKAAKAPWDGGFTWSTTEDGHAWITTTMQGEGGDLWFPCKDHPSDKAERVDLKISVPEPLVVAANGQLISSSKHSDGWTTFHWRTSYPISNYNIALSIGPYEWIESKYTCIDGTVMPFHFWTLPESRQKAEEALPEFKRHMAFYERILGPYPFRNEKYGVVETPHLGMEHQSIIAYGNKFRGGPHGYDWLHHHELGHEWWGNLVTANDWRHFWLHEGLCTYMQILYAEERQGMMAYHHAMYVDRKRIKSEHTLVPAEPASIDLMDDQVGEDVYFKGSWILHTLRYLIGKKDTEKVLHRFAYPDPDLESTSEGQAIRFAGTQDFIDTVHQVTGRNLDWFFDVYLYNAPLPRLIERLQGAQWILEWEVPEGCSFPMPLEIELGGHVTQHKMEQGRLVLDAETWSGAVLDPQCWILMENRSALMGNPYGETFD
jgi:aminopeptidase N